jgi:aerobic carbon-monoxide dehydrogenase medium subunit
MKAAATGYVRANDLAHAIALLADASGDARLIAGGQSLVASMNLRLTGEIQLIDIGRVPELQGVVDGGDTLRIGALTRHADLAANPLIVAHAPLLAQAAPLIAHAAIRNRGTLGGSLAHADPAAELPACVRALDATLLACGPRGERRITADAFFRGLFETDLASDEVLTGIEVKKHQAGDRDVILELARRSGDYAIVGIAAARRQGFHRLAFFGVGDTPVLATDAMAGLDQGDIEAAVAALANDLDPPRDIQGSSSYRLHVAGVLLRRVFAAMQEMGDE